MSPATSPPQISADSVCVFCGSSPGLDPIYSEVASQVGSAIAREGWRLVYGGGQKGLMGTVADAALSLETGSVLGVIPLTMTTSSPAGHPTGSGSSAAASKEGSGPDQLSSDQVAHHNRMETRIVSSMHERKALMAQESQRGFIALPGGYGTFEEVFEMVTWSQLGIHNLPIILVDVNEFWSPLQLLAESAHKNGFITTQGLDLIHFVKEDDVMAQHGGDWGVAAIAATKMMQQRFRGRQGYYKWDQNGVAPSKGRPPAASLDFSGQPEAIKVTDLTYSFQSDLSPSLTNINLSLPQSSRTLLIGANGAGKSTLLRLLAGKRLVSTSRDRTPVTMFGKDVFNSLPQGITYLGTEWAMNPVVRSDIVVEDFLNSVGGYRYKERRDHLLDLLDVDLQWHMHAISDGERRRVQLCMGLMTPWRVLLLDEVTVDLDVQVRSDLLEFLKEEAEQRGATIVYATHIFDGLYDFPSHVVHMRLGGLVEEGLMEAQTNTLLWPPASASRLSELLGTSPSGSEEITKDGLLLTMALKWLRQDRDIREKGEEQGKGGKKRGAKRAAEGVETDSEKFYNKYDYSQTVMR